MSSHSSPGSSNEAEDLRLQGNDAFKTQDYERAYELYQKSVSLRPDAKAYSNLAATLCKLGKYEEAATAAKRSTVVDSQWAKGWWRRAVVADLLKQTGSALDFYKRAVDLDPSNKAFKTALAKLRKRCQLETSTKGGSTVYTTKQGSQLKKKDNPGQNAYERVLQMYPGVSHYGCTAKYHLATQNIIQTAPLSQHYIFHGMSQLLGGMRNSIADLCLAVMPDARRRAMELAMSIQSARTEAEKETSLMNFQRVLGGVPTAMNSNGSALEEMTSGFSHVGGRYFYFHEFETPECMEGTSFGRASNLNLQLNAMIQTIDAYLANVLKIFGPDLKCSKSIFDASKTYYANISGGQMKYPHEANNVEKEYTPEECVAYVKEMLSKGHTWDNGVRVYCALQFKGSLLYNASFRCLPMAMADAYKALQWAIDFINAMDEEFQVTKEKSYSEKGSSFRETFRIGVLLSHFDLHEQLRGHEMNGPYPMQKSIDMCLDMIEMANNIRREGYANNAAQEIAYIRKPLSVACACIGRMLLEVYCNFSEKDWKQIYFHHGFMTELDADVDALEIIAEHYRIAAEEEIDDAPDKAVFWWTYAAYKLQTRQDTLFSLGSLRDAMKNAVKYERLRDTELYGVKTAKEYGTNEPMVMKILEHYQSKEDSFILPQVKLVGEGGKKHGLLVEIDGEVIFSLENAMEEFLNFLNNDRNPLSHLEGVTNNLETEEKHGRTRNTVPPLETLCIRSLHKAGYEFAKGETDAAVIVHKANEMNKKYNED